MEGRRKRCKSQWSAKYRSRSPSQGTCGVRTLMRSTMQGLMVVGFIVEEILKVDIKCVKGTRTQNIGQGHQVKIPAESVHLGEALCSKSLQPKYRSRSPGQGVCRVSTLRRSTLQGLMVVGLIVEEISSTQNVSKSLERKI